LAYLGVLVNLLNTPILLQQYSTIIAIWDNGASSTPPAARDSSGWTRKVLSQTAIVLAKQEGHTEKSFAR